MLERIRGRVLREWDGWAPDLRDAIAARESDAEAILARGREHLARMLASIPDPGWTAPHMRAFTIGGAIYVAVYLALAERGYDAARAWEVCDAATRTHFARMRGLERTFAERALFAWPIVALTRWLAKRSATAPVGGWAFEVIDEPGYDYGVDYTRCAIRELAIAHGAGDFAPYICLSDIHGSDAFGWGITRTETIAQGAGRCDFRFRRGGETRIRVQLPVVR